MPAPERLIEKAIPIPFPRAAAINPLNRSDKPDILPEQSPYGQHNGVFLFYDTGEPPKVDALRHMFNELMAAQGEHSMDFRENINPDGLTEEQLLGEELASDLFLRQLSCIDQAYRNLTERAKYTPAGAIYRLIWEIEKQDAAAADQYSQAIEKISAEEALVDTTDAASTEGTLMCGGEVIHEQPISMEVKRAMRKAKLNEDKQPLELKQERLRFEWLSARAIINVLKDYVAPDEPPIIELKLTI
jgi:hypothetical protein